ncbi:MAG: tetratricopeptide repeat protein, partial [Caldilineaceae bacterium SB0664_bin_22]|nr:tetratricopeptide repeat protein [Caldilineaceae bacterium SB0664_bin_22]
MPMRRDAVLNSKLVGKGTLAVLIGIAVLLGNLEPRGSVAALPVAVAHAQAGPSASHAADAVDVAAWSRQLEDHLSEVHALSGEIVTVEMGPDGDAVAWIVSARGNTVAPATLYLPVGLDQTLAEQIRVGDTVQFTGRIVDLAAYESRMVPAVNLAAFLGQVVCEGNPPICTDLPPPIPAAARPSTAASTHFTVQRTALVLAGPDRAYRMVGSHRRGDVVAPIVCKEDCPWLQWADGQWIFAEAVDGPTESRPLVAGAGSPDLQVSTAPAPPARPAGELTPDDQARSFYEAGIAKAARGQHAEALADFENALRLSPQNAVYLYYRGAMKAHLGWADEAQADFENALRLLPNLPLLLLNQGADKLSEGRFEEALVDFDGALRFDPQYFHALVTRALAQMALGRYAEAI